MFKSLIAASALLIAAGCATNDWRGAEIPYPSTTPFDSSNFARTAYLDGFARGYQAETSGGGANVEMLAGPYREARRQGYYAGAAQARATQEQSRKR